MDKVVSGTCEWCGSAGLLRTDNLTDQDNLCDTCLGEQAWANRWQESSEALENLGRN